MATLEEIRQQEGKVHTLRTRKAQVDDVWKTLQETFHAEHELFVQEREVTTKALAEREAQLRADALELYRADPTIGKTGIPGVTIRDTKAVGWSPAEALAWAIEHKVALKLDEPAYKKLVLADMAPGTSTNEFTVAVAQDLTPFVGSAKGGA